MPETLFVSDLHLDRDRPHIIDLFEKFLAEDAAQADALYILGDLFEYWIGDNVPIPEYDPIIAALRELTRNGTAGYFIPGNRDFLVGKGFAMRTGCQLLADVALIDLYNTPTLIMHGDTLCTDDIAYQRYRGFIRSRLVRGILLSLNLRLRHYIARKLRRKSREEIDRKPAAIMDISQVELERVMRQNDVHRLIHGHTHRPAVHRFSLDGSEATRLVLGDWYTQGSVLRCSPNDCELQALTL